VDLVSLKAKENLALCAMGILITGPTDITGNGWSRKKKNKKKKGVKNMRKDQYYEQKNT
jgi:hypothetical protein